MALAWRGASGVGGASGAGGRASSASSHVSCAPVSSPYPPLKISLGYLTKLDQCEYLSQFEDNTDEELAAVVRSMLPKAKEASLDVHVVAMKAAIVRAVAQLEEAKIEQAKIDKGEPIAVIDVSD